MLSNLILRASMWDNISGAKGRRRVCPFVLLPARLMTITRLENRYNRSELALGSTGVRPIIAATWRTGDTETASPVGYRLNSLKRAAGPSWLNQGRPLGQEVTEWFKLWIMRLGDSRLIGSTVQIRKPVSPVLTSGFSHAEKPWGDNFVAKPPCSAC
jgi:hypothetical protein